MTGNLKLYYKNVTSDSIGCDNGITKEQFDELARVTEPVIRKTNEDRNDGITAYRDVPYIQDNLEKTKQLAAQVRQECDTFALIGAGGSLYTNTAIQTALSPFMYNFAQKNRTSPQVIAFDGTDASQFNSFLDNIEQSIDRTVLNIISKSGDTAQTTAHFSAIYQLLSKRFDAKLLRQKIIITTGSGNSTLRKIADDEGFRNLIAPEGINDMFGILSQAGLFSAAVSGIDVDAVLAGARAMDVKTGTEDLFRNPSALYAAINHYYYCKGRHNWLVVPYTDSLKDTCSWYAGLCAQTLGTVNDLSVQSCRRSDIDYYSRLNSNIFTFIEAGNYSGKLIQPGKPFMSIIMNELNAYNIGQLAYFLQVTASITAKLFNIDTSVDSGDFVDNIDSLTATDNNYLV